MLSATTKRNQVTLNYQIFYKGQYCAPHTKFYGNVFFLNLCAMKMFGSQLRMFSTRFFLNFLGKCKKMGWESMDCSGTGNKGREGGDTIANEEVALAKDHQV